jgi:hypothetical protein
MHLQKGRITREWLARPEIRGCTIEGVVDEKGKPINYGWSPLEGVFQMINDQFEILGVPKLTDSEQVFDRFGPLNGHTKGRPNFTWRNSLGEVMINGEKPTIDTGLWSGKIEIPLGWISSIEVAIKAGIIRTTLEGVTYGDILVDDKPHMAWDTYGYKADETRILISNPKHWDLIMFRELPKPATPLAS